MSLVLFVCVAIAVVVAIGLGIGARGWFHRRARRQAAESIATGSSLPPAVAASLDRARRRAQMLDADAKDGR